MADENVLIESVRNSLEKDRTSSIDEIKTRNCISDNNDGIEITILGTPISIRPIINTISETDNWLIESIGMYSDAEIIEKDNDEYECIPGVIVFCTESNQSDTFTT